MTIYEDKRMELKREVPEKQQILKTAVAFANCDGGKIIIGIDSKENKVVGINVDDFPALEESLSNSIYDSTEPHIIPHITLQFVDEKPTIHIDVSEGSAPPYYLKSEGKENGTYIRVGSATRRADKDVIHSLDLKAGHITYDATPVLNSSEKDISKELAGEFLDARESVRHTPVQPVGTNLYKHYRLIVHGGKMSMGGALCFSKKSGELFPWATIQCARFKGVDEREYLDEAEFGGHLANQIESAIGFIKRNMQKRMKIVGAKRKEEYEYPLGAIRELVVNAVCHRDYSRASTKTRIAIYDDRLECINPGALMAGITIEDLGQGVSEIRNPVIAKILKDWGYIEEWGRGISKVVNACRESGLPPPIFREKGLFFDAVISNVADDLCDNEQLALDFIKKRGTIKASELEKNLGVHRNTALNILRTLLDKRLATKIGKGKNQLYKISR